MKIGVKAEAPTEIPSSLTKGRSYLLDIVTSISCFKSIVQSPLPRLCLALEYTVDKVELLALVWGAALSVAPDTMPKLMKHDHVL